MSSRCADVLTLMYHGLDPGDGRYSDAHSGELAYILSNDAFLLHLEILKKSGRRILLPKEPLSRGFAFSEKRPPVLLSFDDGMRSDYEIAFPLLCENNLKAIFFITTNEVGRPGRVQWRNLQEMAAAGMAIGSHGDTHRLFCGLTTKEQKQEMERSRKALEDHLSVPVTSLSLPGGRYTRQTFALAQECGYGVVFTSEPTIHQREKAGIRLVGRVAVRRDWDGVYFDEFLRNAESWTDRMQRVYAIKNSLQRVLGERLYSRLHQVVWEKKR